MRTSALDKIIADLERELASIARSIAVLKAQRPAPAIRPVPTLARAEQ
jgi:hypothetical protein